MVIKFKKRGKTMKISKKLYNELVSTLNDLKRGQKYLMNEDIHVCKDMKVLTALNGFTSTFKDNEGIVLYSFDKRTGTELCYLNNGINALEKLVNQFNQ